MIIDATCLTLCVSATISGMLVMVTGKGGQTYGQAMNCKSKKLMESSNQTNTPIKTSHLPVVLTQTRYY